MHLQIVLLLAVYLNLIKAGPVHRRGNLAARDLLPRFLNETDSAAPTTTSAIPTTTLGDTIPPSSDTVLESSVPSRIATSKVNDQANNVQNNGGGTRTDTGSAVPFSGVAASSTSAASYLASSSAPTVQSLASASSNTAPLSSQASPSTVAISTEDNNDSPGLPSPSNNLSPGTSSTSSPFASSSMTSGSSSTMPLSSATASSAPPAELDDGGPAMLAFQQARGSKNVAAPSTSTVQNQQVINTSNAGLNSPSISSTSATAIPTVSSASDNVPSIQTLPLSEGSLSQPGQSNAPTASKGFGDSSTLGSTASSSAAVSTPSGGYRYDVANSDITIPSGTLTGQIPTSVLNAAAQNSVQASPSSTQAGFVHPSSQAFPDASVGASKMAQGYNNVFQGLDPYSKCDPSNRQQASACVRGQPAKCEADGTYTLISCDAGQSCYAVPDGNNGVTVGCYTPKDYQAIISNTQSSAVDQQGSQSSTAPGSTLSQVVAPVPQASGNVVQQSVEGASAAALTQNAPVDVASSVTSPKQQTKTSQASFVPTAASTPAPAALADQDGTNGKTGAAQDTFPQPKASFNGVQSAATAAALPTASAASTGASQSTLAQPSASNPPAIPTLAGGSQISPQGPGNDGPAPSPSAASQKGSNAKSSQSASNDNSSDDDSNNIGTVPSRASTQNSGVQLSFPGSPSDEGPNSQESSKANSKQEGQGSGTGNDPQTNQKNAAAAPADAVASSVPVPTSSAAPLAAAASVPVVTPAPVAPAATDSLKGYITVTVTETVTVHD